MATCGICHEDDLAEIGELDSCPHRFCFPCIKQWSEIENRCPFCKSRFGVIRRKQLEAASPRSSPRNLNQLAGIIVVVSPQPTPPPPPSLPFVIHSLHRPKGAIFRSIHRRIFRYLTRSFIYPAPSGCLASKLTHCTPFSPCQHLHSDARTAFLNLWQ